MWERSRWDGRAPTAEAAASPPATDLTYTELDLGEQLGETGTATVFEAQVRGSAPLDRVAVKQPERSATLRRETVEQFLHEAEVWAGLDDHPHVVGVVDYGAEPLPWIAMEFMDGGSLVDRSPSSFPEALWIALGVARAVRHAHTRGVVHHDLKPANVLFREPGEGWAVPKVADWELAQQLLEAGDGPDAYTPRYAAPEQVEPATYGTPDRRTDIFQLGVLWYELFTGTHPFGGAADPVAAAESGPAPPSAVADLPPALDDLLLTALAPEPAARQEDVLDLRRGLERVADALGDVAEADDPGAGGEDVAPPSTGGPVETAAETADDGETPPSAEAGSAPRPGTTVRVATIADLSDRQLVEDAVRDGDVVLSHLAGDPTDATAERVVDQLRQATEAVDGDIVQHGDDELITTPAGYDIARTPLTEGGGDGAEFALAVVEDREDVAAVEAAVRDGVIVLAHIPAEADVAGEAAADDLHLVAREVQGDIVQRGDRDLIVTPTGIDIARERLTE